MEPTQKKLNKMGGLFVGMGFLLVALGSAITFWLPTADFWRGFIHGFSLVANLAGIIFFVTAWRRCRSVARNIPAPTQIEGGDEESEKMDVA